MIWQISSKSRSIISSLAAQGSSISDSFQWLSFTSFPRKWHASNRMKLAQVYDTQFGLLPSLNAPSLSQEATSYQVQNVAKPLDFFEEMKQRFLRFKKHRYLEEIDYFQTLAEAQSPKFMVIACADSRVCPSNVLGLQPGETFMVRNVANLVPPLKNGLSETNAALEFAVNTLEVENILVIGHSGCGGIQALMSIQDDGDSSSLTEKWVLNAKIAKLRTKAEASHLSFDRQCRHCEKESIKISLLNLLTYPWIEDKVKKELLSLHGGYYDFLDCTFEKWTLDYKESRVDEGGGGRYSIKDRSFWC